MKAVHRVRSMAGRRCVFLCTEGEYNQFSCKPCGFVDVITAGLKTDREKCGDVDMCLAVSAPVSVCVCVSD